MIRLHRTRGDDGVTLVLVLLFITVVGLFATVALEKSRTTALSGTSLHDRSHLQYALDAGAERGLDVLQSDVASGSPSKCVETPSSPTEEDLTSVRDGAGLTVNAQTVSFSCETLAGRAASNSDAFKNNYAIVTTSTTSNGLVTSGGGGPFIVNGSVYMAANTTTDNLKKDVEVGGDGDIVVNVGTDATACAASLRNISPLTIKSGSAGLKTCTTQTRADALPTVILPSLSTLNTMSTGALAPLNGLFYTDPVTTEKCRIFFPGVYSAAPALANEDAYFVSGFYYFEGNFTFQIGNNDHVIAGKAASLDVDATKSSACDGVDDDEALSIVTSVVTRNLLRSTVWTQGATFAFGDKAKLSVSGSLVMRTPVATSTNAATNVISVQTTGNGYKRSNVTSGYLVETTSAIPDITFNAKIFAPEGDLSFFASQPTVAFALDGVIAETLTLKGSNQSQTLDLRAVNRKSKPNPPFRTVRVISRDAVAGSTAKTTVVATIDNYAPYALDVLSWRTD